MLEKYHGPLFLLAIGLLGLLARWFFVPYIPIQTPFFVAWGAEVLPGNRALWLAKGVSLAGDVLLALSLGLLVRRLTGSVQRARFAAAAVWLLPTVILNSAAWGQGDAFFTAFLLLFLLFVVRRQKKTAAVCLGIALAVKVPLAVWQAAANQTDAAPQAIGHGMPNLYTLLPAGEPFARQFLPGYTLFGLAITGAATYWFWLRRAHFTPKAVVLVAAFYAVLVPQVLPQVNERSGFLAGTLLLAVVCMAPEMWPLALTAELASLGAYTPALLGNGGINLRVAALFMLLVLAALACLCYCALHKTPVRAVPLAGTVAKAPNAFAAPWHGPLFLVLTVAVGLWVRFYFLPFETGDMSYFLRDWMAQIVENGRLRSLGALPGNYTPAYMFLLTLASYLPLDSMYAVKLLSFAGDLLLAGSVYLLVKSLGLGVHRARLGFAAAFLLPSVILNSAQWGQCDAFYVAFLVLFLAFYCKDKPCRAMLFYGMALAFKQQALFLAPLVVLLVVLGRLRLRALFAALAGYVAWFLPTLLQGGSWRLLYSVYKDQMGTEADRLALLVPNLYNWLTADKLVNKQLRLGYMVFALAVIGVACYILWLGRTRLEKRETLLAAAMFAYLAPYIMPQMHERYFYPAGILLLVVALCWLHTFYAAAICELLTIWSYLQYFYYDEAPLALWTALPPLVVLAGLGTLLYRRLFAGQGNGGGWQAGLP